MFAIAEALWVGLAVGAVSSLLDLPAPTALGVTAGVLSLFPYVGLTLGAIPMLLLTLGFRSLFAAIVLLVVVLVAQLIDSMVVRPRMAERSIADRPGRAVGRGPARLRRLRDRWAPPTALPSPCSAWPSSTGSRPPTAPRHALA